MKKLINNAQLANRIRLVSGLVLFAFVICHLLNHSLGNISIDAMEAGRKVFLAVWRNPVGEAVVQLALVLHILLVLIRLIRRRTLKLKISEYVQAVSGIAVPLLLIGHFAGTHLATDWYGLNDTYVFVIWSSWVSNPLQTTLMITGLVVVWAHSAIGIHLWLRLKPWYPRAFSWLLALAIIIPGLALSGYAGAGKEVALLAMNETWMQAELAKMQLPEDVGAAAARIYGFADQARIVVLVVVAATFAIRFGRQFWLRVKKRITIHYADGRRSVVEVGTSVLEASQLNDIPHAAVCGGRGRCSTCRVRVTAGLNFAGSASLAEQKVLDRVGAGDGVRLACQMRPNDDVSVALLLPPTAQPRDGFRRSKQLQGDEREIAILFADLRSFTKFSESKLPFDVVFALNQYFRAMGMAVEESGGRLDKFIGDGVMALFGIDDGKATGCRDALRCARAMGEGLGHLNEQLKSNLDEPFRIGIGIHTGPAIVGEMGFREVISLTAVGDSVNTASRLEAMTKEHGMQLIVSEEVVTAADVDLSTYPTEQVPIRGREEMLQVRMIKDATGLQLPERRTPIKTGAIEAA